MHIAIRSDLVAVSFKDWNNIELIDFNKGEIKEGFCFEFASSLYFITKYKEYLVLFEKDDWKFFF